MIKVATVFSGIGSVEHALAINGYNHKIVFACDNGERSLDMPEKSIRQAIKGLNNKEANEYVKNLYDECKKTNYVERTYLANYKVANNAFYQDIRFIDGKEYKKKVDLLVGGSPCQSFSIIGKRGGFEDTRGTLFYDYARLIKEIEPKVFIYENVKGMLNHDKGKTWNTVISVFDELDYDIYLSPTGVVNAVNYGIPQNRPRIFIIGIKKGLKLKRSFEFPQKQELKLVASDYYERKVLPTYYLGKKGFEFVTNPKYTNRAKVNQPIIMCEKANQQFNWNGDFVFEPYDPKKHTKEIMEIAYLSTYKGEKGVIRKLTPRECLRLMGFKDSFKIVVKDVEMYREAGNSIVVTIFESLLKELIEVGALNA